jgi:hypothetical protein
LDETEADLLSIQAIGLLSGKTLTGHYEVRKTELTIAFAFRDREHHGQLGHIVMCSIGSIVLPGPPRPNYTNGSHFNRENLNCQPQNVMRNA